MRTLFRSAIILFFLLPAVAAAATLEMQVERVEAGTDDFTSQPIVTVTLTPASRDAFAAFTRARVGEAVQIRVEERIVSAPIVREPIAGGVLVISGQMTEDDARDLAAAMLRRGASLVVDGSDK